MTETIQLSPDDPVDALIKHLTSTIPNTQIQNQIEEGDNYYDIILYCLEESDLFFQLQEEEFLNLFGILFHFLSFLTINEDIEIIIRKFTHILAKSDENRLIEVRIKLLIQLLNLIKSVLKSDKNDIEIHSFVLLNLRQFVFKTNSFHLISKNISNIENALQKYKISAKIYPEILYFYSQIFKFEKNIKKSQSFRIKFINFCAENKLLNVYKTEMKEILKSVIVDAIKYSYNFDQIYQNKTILSIEKDKETNVLFQILEVFVKGNVSNYFKWKETHSFDDISSFDLDEDFILSKLRTIHLCVLGNKHEKLTYEQLKKELNIETDLDVEKCVISSIQTGFLEAKMNQHNKTVLVLKASDYSCGDVNWEEMKKKVSILRNKTKKTLLMLRQANG